MANKDFARGFAPYNPDGNPPRKQVYKAGTTTNIGAGDIVALATNGRIHKIGTTTGSAKIIGVAANFVNASVSPASVTPADVWVYDDPDQLFECQDDGAAATPAQASVGATYPVVLGSPNTTTGKSIQELDISGVGTTSLQALQLVGFIQGPDKAIDKNASCIVRLNRHLYKQGSVGI
jgi:hypothetical protein